MIWVTKVSVRTAQ